jgi:hypothetical protein
VIPVAILAGFVVGRWWVVIPLIGAAWATWLVADGVCSRGCSAGAFLLGTANGAVGVALHRVVRSALSSKRKGSPGDEAPDA